MSLREEQLDTRGAYLKLAILSGGLFVVGTNAFVIAGLLPQIANALGTSQQSVAFSVTSYALVVAVASPAVSILLPRVPRTVIMALGLLLVGAGTALAASADSLAIFTAGRVLSGLGGAAFVPTATAAAPALVSSARHGKALAIVGIGTTIATALGSPVGTALGGLASWRLPLALLAGLAVVVAFVILVAVRHVPLSPSVPFVQRISVLRNPQIVTSLIATTLLMMAFNIVYVFSASIAAVPTGRSASLLSLLLLAFGVGGIVGNGVAGLLTDRLGNRVFGSIAFAVQALALVVMPLAAFSYSATLIVFAFWGVSATAVNIPVQHRLVSIDPAHAGLAMSWFSTAMYAGIAVAPLVGTVASGIGGPNAIPLAGALAALVGLGALQLSYWRLRTSH